MAAVLIVLSNRPAGAESFYMESAFDCDQWTKARNRASAEVYQGYVAGLLNGLSLGRSVEFWHAKRGAISSDAVFFWIDDYCREHPLNNLLNAALDLFAERTGWHPQARIAPLRQPARQGNRLIAAT